MNYSEKLIGVVCLTVVLSAFNLRAGEIHRAAAAGDLNKVRALIEADSTLLESKDNDGNTPLITACLTKQVAVANFLLDKGANVNVRDEFRFTPLSRAAGVTGQDTALIQRLIEKGSDINSQGYNGLTPLHRAASSGDLKVAKLLIDNGADPNAYDKYSGTIEVGSFSSTVLQTAINFSDRKEEMAKLIVESGARLNKKDRSGNTELHLAALKGYADLTWLLIKHGADVNAVNQYNRTALYYAAKHGYRMTADALIAAGAKESTIGETNYGNAPQLTATLKGGEAYLWYLSVNSYAVKTKGHLLLFNPLAIDELSESGLVNGYINLNELVGQKITILFTLPQSWPYWTKALELKKRLPGADFVFSYKPTASSVDNLDTSFYHLAAPNESFSVDGIQVHTIPATSGGMGYLVETDGVNVLYAGLHVSDNKASNITKYRKEIDFLKPFGPIDVAILNIQGHANDIGEVYEQHLYLLDQLSPKAVYLMGAGIPEEYSKCVEVLQVRNIPIAYPEGGQEIGERFHYLRDGTHE